MKIRRWWRISTSLYITTATAFFLVLWCYNQWLIFFPFVTCCRLPELTAKSEWRCRRLHAILSTQCYLVLFQQLDLLLQPGDSFFLIHHFSFQRWNISFEFVQLLLQECIFSLQCCKLLLQRAAVNFLVQIYCVDVFELLFFLFQLFVSSVQLFNSLWQFFNLVLQHLWFLWVSCHPIGAATSPGLNNDTDAVLKEPSCMLLTLVSVSLSMLISMAWLLLWCTVCISCSLDSIFWIRGLKEDITPEEVSGFCGVTKTGWEDSIFVSFSFSVRRAFTMSSRVDLSESSWRTDTSSSSNWLSMAAAKRTSCVRWRLAFNSSINSDFCLSCSCNWASVVWDSLSSPAFSSSVSENDH